VYSSPDKEKKKQISANYSRHVWCRKNHAVRKHKSLEKKKKNIADLCLEQSTKE
jgi:hypothetical protein